MGHQLILKVSFFLFSSHRLLFCTLSQARFAVFSSDGSVFSVLQLFMELSLSSFTGILYFTSFHSRGRIKVFGLACHCKLGQPLKWFNFKNLDSKTIHIFFIFKAISLGVSRKIFSTTEFEQRISIKYATGYGKFNSEWKIV